MTGLDRRMIAGCLGALLGLVPGLRGQETPPAGQDGAPPVTAGQDEQVSPESVLRLVPSQELQELRRAFARVEQRVVHLTVYRSDDAEPDTAYASGLLLDANGDVVTTAITLDRARRAVVRFLGLSGQAPRRARILGVDPSTGLGLVTVGPVEVEDLFAVEPPQRPAEGMRVLSVGSREESVVPWASLGQVQSRVEGFLFGGRRHSELWQVSVMGPTRSEGGVVAGGDGRPLGLLLSHMQVVGPNNVSIALIVPMDRVKEGVERIRAAAPEDPPPLSDHPWLGLSCLTLNDPALRYHLGVEGGVIVIETMHESPAEQMGIGRYDVVLAWNGEPIRDAEHFHQVVKSAHPGEEVELSVVQRGVRQDLSLTLGHW